MTKQPPLRPRVVADLPVLRRGPGQVQIGLDPRHATVIENLSEAVSGAALRLTGHHSNDELLANLAPDDQAGLSALITALQRRGLVDDASNPPAHLVGDAAADELRVLTTGRPPKDHPIERSELGIDVQGEGRLAVAIACMLAGAGVGWVRVSATGSVSPEDIGTGYQADDVGSSRLVAARRAIVRAADGTRTAAFSRARRPDLVILADSLVPRPERVDRLMARGATHLVVRVRDTTGIVGPLVVPGMTSCLRCADLHRCDRDERWPHLATQLAGKVQLTGLAGTYATAAFAVAQALDAVAWLQGATTRPATCDTTVEITPSDASTRHRGWSAHPLCPCGATARPQLSQWRCTKVAADSGTELRQSNRDGDAS